jgi:hypothetical protein
VIEDSSALEYNATLIIGTVVIGISDELASTILNILEVRAEQTIARLTPRAVGPSLASWILKMEAMDTNRHGTVSQKT